MRPPSGLDPAARAAWRRCETVLGADLGGFRDAVERYCRAVDLEVRVRREWEALGRPLLVKHGAVGIHPLVKLLASTAAAAADHGARLGMDPMSSKRLYGPGHGGRPVGANSAPDRVAPWEPPRSSVVRDDMPPLLVKKRKPPKEVSPVKMFKNGMPAKSV